ncbi:MAG: hypothetical protein NTX22_12950 [Ignavibacteriales bacterium]|nr:hypothetical protein [Ignavibacteriales bacterium]
MSLFDKIFNKKNNEIPRLETNQSFPVTGSSPTKNSSDYFKEISFVKLEHSFIPSNLLTQEIKNYESIKILCPNTNDDLFEIFLGQKIPMETIPSLINEANKYKQKFWDFEKLLLHFALQQVENKEYALADQCLKYLLEIGSKSIQVIELFLRIYFLENNQQGKQRLHDLIVTELSNQKTFYYRKKLNQLILQYSDRLFSRDEIWFLYNAQLSKIEKLDECSAIYELMGNMMLSDGNPIDAVYKYIVSYCTEAQYMFFMDTALNSDNYKKYKTNDFVKNHLKKLIKKAKFENKGKEIISLVEKYMIDLPKIDLIKLKEEVGQILEVNT